MAINIPSVDLQWLGAAFLSTIAVYLGYCLIQNQKEAPEFFNVPIPSEIRTSDWSGRNWDDIQGEEKRVLEGQARGVSKYYGFDFCFPLSFALHPSPFTRSVCLPVTYS